MFSRRVPNNGSTDRWSPALCEHARGLIELAGGEAGFHRWMESSAASIMATLNVAGGNVSAADHLAAEQMAEQLRGIERLTLNIARDPAMVDDDVNLLTQHLHWGRQNGNRKQVEETVMVQTNLAMDEGEKIQTHLKAGNVSASEVAAPIMMLDDEEDMAMRLRNLVVMAQQACLIKMTPGTGREEDPGVRII